METLKLAFIIKQYRTYILEKFLDLYYAIYTNSIKNTTVKMMLQYCSRHIDFYKDKGTDIEKYGYLDKKIINSSYHSLLNKNIRFTKIGRTSGSTGTPTKFVRDIRSIAVEHHYLNEYFGWKGKFNVVLRGDIFLNPKIDDDVIYLKIPFLKKLYASSFHINDVTLAKLVRRISAIQGKSLWAYPSSAYLLAEYCIRNGAELKFDVVATSSETLLQKQAEVIEQAFGCRIRDWYGQAERVAALYRCEYGHYHEPEGYAHIEYIEDSPGIHEIAGTTLHNRAMPLVRVKTGDLVEMGNTVCPCGSGTKHDITRIIGRQSSVIELPEYTIPECVVGCLLKSVSNIIESQIYCTKEKRLVFKIVKNSNFNSDDESLLKKVIFEIFPSEFCMIEYVDSIARNASGKFQFIINESINSGTYADDFSDHLHKESRRGVV